MSSFSVSLVSTVEVVGVVTTLVLSSFSLLDDASVFVSVSFDDSVFSSVIGATF